MKYIISALTIAALSVPTLTLAHGLESHEPVVAKEPRGSATSTLRSGGLRGDEQKNAKATTSRGNATSTAAHDKDVLRPGMPYFLRWLFGAPSSSVKDLKARVSTTTLASTSRAMPLGNGIFGKFFEGIGKIFGM